MMHIANEFYVMISNRGTGFKSPSGLFPEDFDQICYLSQKTKLRKVKINEITNTEEKNCNTSSYSKLERKQEMLSYPCIDSYLFIS